MLRFSRVHHGRGRSVSGAFGSSFLPRNSQGAHLSHSFQFQSHKLLQQSQLPAQHSLSFASRPKPKPKQRTSPMKRDSRKSAPSFAGSPQNIAGIPENAPIVKFSRTKIGAHVLTALSGTFQASQLSLAVLVLLILCFSRVF